MQPDEIDKKIMEILGKEHTNNNDIARKLNMSEGAIRQRLRRLKEAGILKIRGLINPEGLAGQQLALVAINIADPKLLDEKAQELAKLDNALSASVLSGQYDIMLEVLVDSNKGLMNFIMTALSTVTGITKTETFVLMKSYNKWI